MGPEPSTRPPGATTVQGPLLSVVIPTYNEAANIQPLIAALDEALAGLTREYVVVDDDSKDGTARLARAASPLARVIVRTQERGLATAVVRGIAESRGEYVAVMDADFQHPPEAVRALLDRARSTSADLVVGSRYARGGSEGNFGLVRRTISKGARGISKLVLPPIRRFRLTDPMSGLFLVRRDHVDAQALRPSGYKILLEILGRSELHHVEEVGYTFQDRRGGASKLGPGVIVQFLTHVLALGMVHPDNLRLARFMAVGASGVLVNLGILAALHEVIGLEVSIAVLLAIEVSILWNFALNDRYTFRGRHDVGLLARLGMYNLVSLGGLVANFLTFFALHYFLGLHYLVAQAFAIPVGFGVNYLGNVRFTYGGARRPALRRWLPIAILVVASSGFYFATLDEPRQVYFDESHYLAVAYQMENGVWNDPCHGTTVPLNYEHPPLAKLILYASIHAYDDYSGVFLGCRSPDQDKPGLPQPCYTPGNGTVDPDNRTTGPECFRAWTDDMKRHGNPYAWRGPSALFGVLTVTFGALAARRIFRSDVAGGLAGAFILADNLLLTTARIALLDIFAVGFTVMAAWAATHPTRKGVLGTFLLLGLGFSCKYSVLFAGPPIALLSMWSHYRAGRLTKRRFDWHWVSALAIPPLVWLATYLPWWVAWTRAKDFGYAVATFVKVQVMAFQWDTGLGATNADQQHQYQSTPLEWISMSKPMSYIGPGGPQADTVAPYVYAVGNPILWWGAGLAIIYALIDYGADYISSLFRRLASPMSFFASLPRIKQAILVSALIPLFTFGGFFLLHRSMYIFYMALVVPFLAIALAGTLAYVWASPSRAMKATVVGACVLVGIGFLWFFQVSIYMPIPRNGFAWVPVPGSGSYVDGVRVPGTGLYYPALGFNIVMRAIPWMRPFGNQDCWDKAVAAADCT